VAGAEVESQDLAALYAGPAGTSRIFAEALLAGDVRAATRCFDPRGSILTADGTEVSGAAGIAEILGQIAASRVRLRIRLARTLRAGPVAMTTQIWERDINGSTASSTARLVLHESAGRWSILIAAPWGSG
jgi:hypothetical protein